MIGSDLIERLEDRLTPAASQIPTLIGASQFAVGEDAGGGSTVQVYNSTLGTLRTTFTVPFSSNVTGGIRTAAADFGNTGVADVVAATGPGVTNQVVVLDGTTGAVLDSFQPFETTFTGGLYVTTGDVNGDGIPDLVVTPDQTGGPVVAVYDGASLARGQVTQIDRFFGINDPSFRGGARAAVANINNEPMVVVAAGFGGGPRVAIYDGNDVAQGLAAPSEVVPDFFAFETTLRNGVYLAAGDLNGDGNSDIVFGAGPGGAPRVRVENGQTLITDGGTYTSLDDIPSAQLANFFAGNTNNTGGIRVSVKNLGIGGQAGIVVGSGTGDGSTVTGYTSSSLAISTNPSPIFSFNAFPGFNGGVFVG